MQCRSKNPKYWTNKPRNKSPEVQMLHILQFRKFQMNLLMIFEGSIFTYVLYIDYIIIDLILQSLSEMIVSVVAQQCYTTTCGL